MILGGALRVLDQFGALPNGSPNEAEAGHAVPGLM